MLIRLVCAVVLTHAAAGLFRPRQNMRQDDETTEQVEHLKRTVSSLSRQVMMQQLYVEEQARSGGHSGIKAIRGNTFGTRPYFANSHVGGAVASIHNHANNIRTVGLGEFVAVLNGVEFRTRHNDYGLHQKCRTCREYGSVEEIPFPEVPPEVRQRSTVQEQIDEMKEWFKAWRDQDHSVRDYRQYFKPVLCYLEGAWTYSDEHSIDESFTSDRHFLDADSWLDLQEKIRFSSYTGSKSNLENFAYLPTTIMHLINDTIPVLAQWNYKILCHPLEHNVPLRSLRVIDDLKTRMQFDMSMDDLRSSRAARFQINVADESRNPWTERSSKYGLLDNMMAEIPGLDNYIGDLRDNAFGVETQPYPRPTLFGEELNTAFYHRSYKVSKKGAMGLSARSRGFNDENLFMAMTTQPKIAGLELEVCKGGRRNRVCNTTAQKWSYAVPLEIIYLTPLNSWNPYGIQHFGDARTDEGKTIYRNQERGRRDGSNSLDKAFNGTNSKVYYITPATFFEDEFDFDPADTTEESTYVLGADDQPHQVKASGVRTFLPNIPGVGVLRQRYPIMPVYGEGGAVWKELEALKDIVLFPSKYRHMVREDQEEEEEEGTLPHGPDETEEELSEDEEDEAQGVFRETHFRMASSSAEYGTHTHEFSLSAAQMEQLNGDGRVFITAEEAEGHSHELVIKRVDRNRGWVYVMVYCDGNRWQCWDGHTRKLNKIRD